MPYITQQSRKELEAGELPASPGELNYLITVGCLNYLKGNRHRVGYTEYNEIVGILECVKLEFYRRAVAAYEDEKIKENGDVYVPQKG